MNPAEEQLVESAKTSPEAFGQLFDMYYGRVFNFCLKRVGHRQTAEDITADIFLKVLKNISGFKYKGAPFAAWLFRIANNEVYSYFRQGKVQTSSLERMQEDYGFDIAGDETAGSLILETEGEHQQFQNFYLIRQALLALPEEYQQVLSLRYFDQKQILEIADILDKKEGTVKSLLSRGVGKLKAEIERQNIVLQPAVPKPVVINEERN